eukprot:1143240-Pelagomonas_calceolata.AAC.7
MDEAAWNTFLYTPACTDRMHTAIGTLTKLLPTAAVAPEVNAMEPAQYAESGQRPQNAEEAALSVGPEQVMPSGAKVCHGDCDDAEVACLLAKRGLLMAMQQTKYPAVCLSFTSASSGGSAWAANNA